MADTTKPPRRSRDRNRTDDDPVPRVVVRDLGFRGAGWVVVDGQPVVVIDESLSELDRRRYLVAIMNDLRSSVYVCPACGATSVHPDDIAQGYCGRCHAFTRDGER